MTQRRFFPPLQDLVAPLRRRLGGRPRVAFVFSGGGSLGAVQIGMLRALVEAGINPDLIVGCSVGAINGAAFAAEPSLRGVARLERIWRKLALDDPALMPAPRLPTAVQLARKGESLHDPRTLETLLTDELPASTFEELRVPFHCVATDLEQATEHWFTEGPLVPALMASASLPAVYPAHVHEGRTFIDGGVLNEVHTDRALELGATELYVLHVGHLDDRRTEVVRPFDSALRAYWTARRWRLGENLRQVPPHCTLHRLPSGTTPRLRFDDFSQGPDLAEIAYAQTAEYLETGQFPTTPDEPHADQAPGPDDETSDRASSGGGISDGRTSDAKTAESAASDDGDPGEPGAGTDRGDLDGGAIASTP